MRVKLFVTGICYVVLMTAVNTLVLGMPLWHPYRLFYLACLALYTVGALSKREDLQGAVVILILLLLLMFALAPWSVPGGLEENP